MKKLFFLVLTMALLFTSGAYALTLDAAEEAVLAEDTAVLSATVVPGLNIFTGTTAVKDFEDGSHTFWVADASNTRGVVDNATEKAGTGNTTKVLRLYPNTAKEYFRAISNTHHLYAGRRYEFKLDTHIAGFRDSGDLRLNIQQIGTEEYTSQTSFYQINDADWKANEKAGIWHTHNKVLTVKNESGTDFRLQFRVSNGTSVSGVKVYMDNLSAIPYYNITYKHPDGDKLVYALRDANGNILTAYEPLMTEGYAIKNNGTKVHVGWSTKANDTAAMKSIPLANADLTLYPVYKDIEDITLETGRGKLIYFHDFEIGLNNINYVNYDYIDGASLILNEANTVAEYKVDPTDKNNHAVKLTNSKQTASGDNAQKIYRVVFTDTTEKVGRYTVEYRIMSEGEGTVGDMHNAKLTVGGASGNYTEPAVKSALSSTKGKWVGTLGTINVKEPSENSYTVSVSGCSWVQNKAISNTYLGGIYVGGRGTVEALYIDDVKLYYYPAGSFLFNDGESLKLIEAAASKYKMPSAEDVFGTDIENLCGWTDGSGNTYLVGEEVSVADIEYKTLTPVTAEVPENSGTAEMRVSTSAAKTGIRFKASLAPSVKAKAESAGFIVARADVLDSLGADLTFDITSDKVENAEGTLFVKGEAYNKAAGKDIVYSADNNGNEFFTAVCVGFNVANKSHITTELVARPYIVYTLSDGSAFTAYGESYSSSLYSVADTLKSKASAGDEAAVNTYESASYDGGNYIDDIITVAIK